MLFLFAYSMPLERGGLGAKQHCGGAASSVGGLKRISIGGLFSDKSPIGKLMGGRDGASGERRWMTLDHNCMLLPGCQYAKHFVEQLPGVAKEHAIIFLSEQRIVHARVVGSHAVLVLQPSDSLKR